MLVIDGVEVHYKIAGAGGPVIILHGWGGSIAIVDNIFQDVAQTHLAVAIDLPGHGSSALPPRDWTVGDYANCVLGIMDQLDIPRADFIGHSFGGRITIKLAALHPDRVRRIVLVNSAGVLLPKPRRVRVKIAAFRILQKTIGLLGPPGERLREKMRARMGSADYRNAGPLRKTLVNVVNEDLSPHLPAIQAPALLIWGREDRETPVQMAEIMQARIPSAQLEVFDHAGHFSYLDEFGKFRLLLRRFLRD